MTRKFDWPGPRRTKCFFCPVSTHPLENFRQKGSNNPRQQREKDTGSQSDGEESRTQNRKLVKDYPTTPKGP